uniref:Uncharacterized protein n=1 Tax=Arundo donax TaxID=35708 RepID=A0A0A8XZB2_ARUDO
MTWLFKNRGTISPISGISNPNIVSDRR